MSCPLCDRIGKKSDEPVQTETIAHGFYWEFFYCKTDGLPMAVLRRHSNTMNYVELMELLVLVNRNSELKDLEIRTQARQITDHIHFHFVRGD